MKLYNNLIALFILALILYSCGSEEDGDILGTYRLIEVSSSGCDDPEDNVSFDLSGDGCQNFGGEEICISGSMTFTESTFTTSLTISSGPESETIDDSGSYTLIENSITICNSDGCEESSLMFSNNELTIRFHEDTFGCALIFKGKK